MTAIELGRISFSRKGVNRVHVTCNAFAYHSPRLRGYDALKVVSFAGPAASVKAALAMLRDGNACYVYLDAIPGHTRRSVVPKERGGKWASHVTSLGSTAMRLRHAVAWDASDSTLLLDDSEASLWRVLKSDRFTTPVLRGWVPWIAEQAQKAGFFRPLERWGCQAARLIFTTHWLDQTVQRGVREGYLRLVAS